MRETEDFIQIILNAQRNRAKEFVQEIYESNSQKYADSLVTVILVQTNRELQKIFQRYYVDETYVADNSHREKVSDLIDAICDAIKENGKENGERIFRKAVSYIDSNLSDNCLCAGSVAKFVGVSGSMLSKLFENRLGISPGRYIAENRVKNSIGFLMKNAASIKDVAEKSGFSSAEAYIRAFKKIYGITPGRYKQKE